LDIIDDNGNKKSYHYSNEESKRVVTGVLAILFGSLGIHKFVLGYTKEGLIQIGLSMISFGVLSIIGFIEGIIYLTKSDDEFVEIYQNNHKGWF
jgi:TM2 domain-containing membrane protein YozV